jgi:long-chain acyl-CoA synthetase
VAEAVRRAAERDPAAPALIGPTPDGVITWGELDARVDAVAAALRGMNLPAAAAEPRSGEERTASSAAAPHSTAGAPARVAIALPQVPEFAAVFFGVLRAGLVAVPVNPAYTARELHHVLADSGAALLVATASAATAITAGPRPGAVSPRADLSQLLSIYAWEPIDGARPYSELTSPSGPVRPAGEGEDLAVLLYTSGTSGAPKGAMLPHRALVANQVQVAGVRPAPVGPGDVVLLALPLFHIFGLSAGLVAVAYHGACGVLLDRFDPGAALQAIARHRVSVVGAVPQMYSAWLTVPEVASQFSSVRIAVSGGAPLAGEVARQFLAVTGRQVHQGYGLTETAPVLTMGLASPVPKATSIGRPAPGVEVRLVAGDGSVVAEITADGLVGGPAWAQPVTAGSVGRPHGGAGFVDDDAFDEVGTDPGEIVVRGENLFQGYWPDGAGGPDADGWWATGDVAYADADGDLFLVDRLGDLIIVNGFNVYPLEVEQVLVAHPEVAEAAVVGVPDARTGEGVHAFVVPVGGGISVEDLRDHCGRNLARYKCPTSYEVVAQLPRSAIGKVRKGTLRAREAAS